MGSKILLYTLTGSPPGTAVEMVLKHLGLPYTAKQVDYFAGEHFSKQFLEIYPQGEIPVLKDNDLVIGESVAIIQYLTDKYGKDETFYPKNPEQRSVVNHRLAFHLSTYQRRIYDYVILPMDYAYDRTEDGLKKMKHALGVFDEFLRRQNTQFVAGDNLTIADPPLMMATAALDAIEFDFSPYPRLLEWYQHFQKACPELWEVGVQGFNAFKEFSKNPPPDMSHLKHPLHPTSRQ